MAYAVDTKVSVVKTQNEIRALVAKHQATHFAVMEEPGRAHVAFRLAERNIRFSVGMPKATREERAADVSRREKVERSRWRALMLVIRAKLESVESGIETLEEAFLAQVQMPSGHTVYEELKEPLALRYRANSNMPLLGPPSP